MLLNWDINTAENKMKDRALVFRISLLLFGVAVGASSVVFIKASSMDGILLASYRQLAAAFILSPLFFINLKKHKLAFSFKLILPSVLPGIFLSLHFITWIYGARSTPAANATLIVNMVPIVMPFLLFFVAREIITGREIAGTLLAMAGVLVLGGSDFSFAAAEFRGDLICFVSMLFFAVYMVLAKRNSSGKSVWLYVVPLYFIGGLFCFLIGLFISEPFAPVKGFDILMILGLALGPTIIGHSALNYSMKVLRGQLVSLLNLTQFLFAAVMGFVFFREVPGLFFYIASFLIIAGTVLIIMLPHSEKK
jgi:drug/metabolite transporter (DMT)-like permease